MAASKSYTVSLNVVGDNSNAKKSITELGDHGEGTAGRMHGAFSKMLGTLNSSGVLGPFGEALSKIDEGLEHIVGHGATAGKALAGIGATALGVGTMMAGIGSKDAEAQAQLKVAIENTGQSYEDYKDRIEHSVKAQEKHATSAAETQRALQTLTTSIGDPTKALAMLNQVSDMAAAKHMSLADMAEKVGKAYANPTKMMKLFGVTADALGPSMKEVTVQTKEAEKADASAEAAKKKLADLLDIQHSKSKLTEADHLALRNAQQKVTDAVASASAAHQKLSNTQDDAKASSGQFGDAMTVIEKKVHGQAEASVDSFTGKLRVLKTEVEDQAAKFGQKYGPAITAAGAGMSMLGGLTEGASAILGRFKTAQEASAVATEAMSVAEDGAAVSEGLALAPILLIIAALVILGVGIYELATHWSQVWHDVQNWTENAIGAVQSAIGAVIGWIGSHWQLLLAILTGPFGLAALFIFDHFNQIVSFISGLPGRIGSVASGMFDGIKWAFKAAVNYIIDGWNGLQFGIPTIDTHIPGVGKIGGGSFGVPHIPRLAAGGIAVAPTLGLFGEAGTEAIVPLSRAGEFGFGGGGDGHGHDIILDGQKVGRAVSPHVRGTLLRGSQRRTATGAFA